MINHCVGKNGGVMTSATILCRWQMIFEFAESNNIIVAVCAAGFRTVETEVVVKCAGHECTRIMAIGTVPVVRRR